MWINSKNLIKSIKTGAGWTRIRAGWTQSPNLDKSWKKHFYSENVKKKKIIENIEG